MLVSYLARLRRRMRPLSATVALQCAKCASHGENRLNSAESYFNDVYGIWLDPPLPGVDVIYVSPLPVGFSSHRLRTIVVQGPCSKDMVSLVTTYPLSSFDMSFVLSHTYLPSLQSLGGN